MVTVTDPRAPVSFSARAPAATMSLVPRVRLPGAIEDRLFFAQVREDPALEIEALSPSADDHVAVVASGGCTALSLLGAGAGRVTAVDLNVTQNHIVELKAQAVAAFDSDTAVAFLGGKPAGDRALRYAGLRSRLSDGARTYWDARPAAIRRGVLGAGTSERFIAAVVAVMRLLVHPTRRVERLLACRTLEEQRALYDQEWNSRRWRLLFSVLLNRRVFNRAYDPAFFALVENPSFPRHFHALVERGLTRLPVHTNYFLHQMITGRYPEEQDALPPYLTTAGIAGLRAGFGRRGFAIVDGGMTDWLRTQPAASVNAFALSNIGEWLDARGLDELFGEVVRTAAPGARLVYRNFVGWTEVPERWRGHIAVDEARGDALSARDRSLLQRRIVVCRVRGGAA